jgi:hypothetical protein
VDRRAELWRKRCRLRVARFADQLPKERAVGRARRAGLEVFALLVDERFESSFERDPLELLLSRFAVHVASP